MHFEKTLNSGSDLIKVKHFYFESEFALSHNCFWLAQDWKVNIDFTLLNLTMLYSLHFIQSCANKSCGIFFMFPAHEWVFFAK